MKNSRLKNLGPGILVAAAFIGPGTITACTLAGVSFGYSLLWALLFSVLATMSLQEMAARLGLVTGKGLADAVKEGVSNSGLRTFALVLIISAILVGNAAYEAGNIGGATLGLASIFGNSYVLFFPWVIGIAAFLLLWFGNYKLLERVFVGLIFLMSIAFVVTAILTKPDFSELLNGLFVPNISSESLLTIIALVGTTIVPYNLFLHASLVNEKWNGVSHLKSARWDTLISIAIGGVVSMAIIISASAIDTTDVNGADDLAKGLEPLFGAWANYFMGIGLFAAGLTSSITAPLAAAYVAKSCFGWDKGLKDWRFRMVWVSILLIGVLFLTLKIKPIEVIKFAQVANGILLPLIAFILLWMVNKTSVMASNKNSMIQNTFGILILLLTLFLGAKSIAKVFGLF
ncbi:Nramp family divalent metal transporter [Croceivirga thetidis]|uniref:Nramp family divalent metal transporter n=1 Tax=Croceivirga thetidis TaxID=2721623 RepID=A0ABX1GUN1_9FLAO|nr:Nramp family divalent metal transporter [Croceivirga thetidis]